MKTILMLAILTISLPLMLGEATDAFAVSQILITATDGGGGQATITIDDGGLGDLGADPGVVAFLGSLGCADLNLSVGSTKPMIGETMMPEMDVTWNLISTDECHLEIEFTDIDFDNGRVSFDGSMGGTTSGTVDYTAYLDAGNVPFAKTNEILTTGPMVGGAGDLYGGASAGVEDPFGMYSLTLFIEVWHDDQSTISSGDAILAGQPPVGGSILSVDTTALVLAGLFTSPMLMLPIIGVAATAGTAFTILRRLRKEA